MTRKPEYCTNIGVESCNECSMVNYGRDCHNNPVARDVPDYPWLDNNKSDWAEDIRKGEQYKALSIVSKSVDEAIAHRAETLYRERNISMLDRCDGDWVSEFAETDTTMRTLHEIKQAIRDARQAL